MTTGEKIKRLRVEKGWTQQELGDRIGVQKAAVNKYEDGSVVNLKRKTIEALSAAFGVAGAWLIDDSEWSPVYLETDPEEQHLLSAWRAADELTKAMVRRTLGMEEKKDTSQPATLPIL